MKKHILTGLLTLFAVTPGWAGEGGHVRQAERMEQHGERINQHLDAVRQRTEDLHNLLPLLPLLLPSR